MFAGKRAMMPIQDLEIPLYVGIYRVRISEDKVFVEGTTSSITADEDDLQDETHLDFWETLIARNSKNYEGLGGFAIIETSRKTFSCLRIYDNRAKKFIDKTAKINVNAANFIPQAGFICLPRGLLKNPKLKLEDNVLLAASTDGQTFALWNRDYFYKSGCY